VRRSQRYALPDEAKGKQTMKIEYIQSEDFKAITKAAYKGGWTERAVTVFDSDLAKSNCLFEDGGYITVNDAYDITVLRIDANGFVSIVKEID
jgi:hypothetical protein